MAARERNEDADMDAGMSCADYLYQKKGTQAHKLESPHSDRVWIVLICGAFARWAVQAYYHEGSVPLQYTDQCLNIEMRNASADAGHAFFGTASMNSGVCEVESMCV